MNGADPGALVATGNGQTHGPEGAREKPGTVDDARRQLMETRRRMSEELDEIEARLRRVGGDLRERLDVLEPARKRIRADVWGSLALAVGVGLAFALASKHRDERAPRGRRRASRGLIAQVVRSGVAKLPGAVLGGVRAGVAGRVREEWESGRPTHQLRAAAGE